MRLFTSLESYTPLGSHIALTIGNFDGVHLGHQALFGHLKEQGDESVALCFSNHPTSILSPQPTLPLMTQSHKILILKDLVDTLLLIPFTKELSLMSAESFLIYLRRFVPFSSLLTGENASFGHKKEGNTAHVHHLSQKLHFTQISLSLVRHTTVLSSTHIRSLIQTGALHELPPLLGRPYSFFSPNAPFSLPNLILPPSGYYPVTVEGQQGTLALCASPTLHLPLPTCKKEIEVIF